VQAPFSNEGQSVFIGAARHRHSDHRHTQWLQACLSGTSASAAIVGGVAGFMKSVDPSLSNGVIVGRIARTADSGGDAGRDGQRPHQHARVRWHDTSLEAVQPAGADPWARVGRNVAAVARTWTGAVQYRLQPGRELDSGRLTPTSAGRPHKFRRA
jgi:hypothetical protein